MEHEHLEVRTPVQFVQQGRVALHGVMEAGHPVHVDVILPGRDRSQVHKHLQLVDAWGRGETGQRPLLKPQMDVQWIFRDFVHFGLLMRIRVSFLLPVI